MIVCCFMLTGCGSDNGSKGKSELSTLSKNKDLTSQLSKKKDTPEFIMMGTRYELPSKLQAFYDQGWELIDQIEDNPFVKDTLMIEPESYVMIVLSKDYKIFKAQVDNTGKEAIPLNGEATVTSVEFYNSNIVTADDFVFAGKGTIKSSIDDLASLYAEYTNFTNKDSGISYATENGYRLNVINDTEKSVVESVRVSIRGKNNPFLSGMTFADNEVIDKAKSASVDFKFSCEVGVKYPPKKYKKLLEDINTEDGVHNIIVSGKVIEKAAAKSSNAFVLDSGEEIYVIEDELGNKYAFYSKIGNNFEVDNLNIGDTVKLYCGNVEIINVDEEVDYPLLNVKIVYVNDALLVDASSE